MQPKLITTLPNPARFWSHVDIRGADDCWEWQAARQKRGLPYGISAMSDGNYTAHRIAYALAYGIPTPDELVLHSCDNPPCCNPAHLFLGTHADNAQDRDDKQRRDRHAPKPTIRGENHWSHRQPEMVRRGADCPRSKLTSEIVTEIRTRYAAGGIAKIQLATEYGIQTTSMCKLLQRKTWAHQDHNIPTEPPPDAPKPPRKYTPVDPAALERGSERYNARLNDDAVREIRRLRAAKAETIPSLAARFGVSAQTIKLIAARKDWKHVTD